MVQDWMISSMEQEFCQPNWWQVTEFLVNLLKKDLNLEERRRGYVGICIVSKIAG
jgi:hypothetical protein